MWVQISDNNKTWRFERTHWNVTVLRSQLIACCDIMCEMTFRLPCMTLVAMGMLCVWTSGLCARFTLFDCRLAPSFWYSIEARVENVKYLHVATNWVHIATQCRFIVVGFVRNCRYQWIVPTFIGKRTNWFWSLWYRVDHRINRFAMLCDSAFSMLVCYGFLYIHYIVIRDAWLRALSLSLRLSRCPLYLPR